MRLFFIRHGESVDNVAGIYGGSRDAPLTAHGALQARRLASSLAEYVAMTHVFSSRLQRAAETAGAVRDAQNEVRGAALDVLHVDGLREKDFGSMEGVPFRLGAAKGKRPVPHDAETAESMRARAERFLDEHLGPLICGTAAAAAEPACAIVAHGLILTVLVKALFQGFPRSSMSPPLVPGHTDSVMDGSRPRLPPWSNTGVLEVTVRRPQAPSELHAVGVPLQLHIERVNCTLHLKGLHKTRGGIGSAPFDANQRTIDRFLDAASGQQKPRPGTS